ncbi:MAG: exo-alpha-sialidase [Clostridia bacterium]|nr:exo-alpha-sialidase [Clostridia bacterium]
MYAQISEKKYLGKIVKEFPPTKDNPRNGTGGFYRMDNGVIALVYDRYHGESNADDAPCDIAVTYSYDDGETFTEPEIVMTCADVDAYNICSVSLLRLQDGSIAMFYIKRANGTERKTAICYRKTTDFKTFSEEIEVTDDGYWILNPQRVIRCKNGNIIVPVAHHAWRKLAEEERALYSNNEYTILPATNYFFISSDDGKTFKKSNKLELVLDDGIIHDGLQEPGVQELDDGRLFAYARTSLGRHYQSYSTDGGMTWSTPLPSKFTGPLSPLDFIRLSSGEFAIVYNPVPWYPGGPSNSPWRGRTPFVFRVGDGNLNKIGDAYILDDDPNGHYCYTAFLECEDSLLMVYMAGGENGLKGLSNLRIRKIKKSEFL